MKIKVITLKNWCNSNITPLAWQRIIIKILPQLREKGFELDELEEPAPDRLFQEEEFKLFSGALNALYNITFPQEVMDKIQ
ncbi:hypothetical protein N6H18_16655 [Reichenbachiella agarivorans]|uniref:Uncharacterized protein n=1 Tax=Reichenbachiella agarivorans TaxID=2979464 RepID=A0ABY6CNB6_9BACT|nr:hypothetical protein [Reichenbachiella agarivorans]UXP31977.1 hypothetical protein N6H18_16655 [Reichenbachiella agarivorans]